MVRVRAEKPFERIHSDIMGPIRLAAFQTGAEYIVTFTNDYSRYVGAYPINNKTQLHLGLMKFLNDLKSLTGENVKIGLIRTDN